MLRIRLKMSTIISAFLIYFIHTIYFENFLNLAVAEPN